MSAYEKELAVAQQLARQAGDFALQYRKGEIEIENKADESPVTVADKEGEKIIVAGLSEAFPEDGLLGEEGAVKDTPNGRKWIIDPIDGTRDFIRNTRAWSVLIGLEEKGACVAGVAYFPATSEMYYASKGGGAWCNGQRLQAGNAKKPAEALLCVNGLSFLHRYPFAPDLLEFFSLFWTVRSTGGCLDAMLVASGKADAWIEAQAKPWDLAPLKIIVEEAGAVTFDFAGKDTIYGGNFVIAVPGLADQLRRFVGPQGNT
ncbi:MAG TPA: inositol monophosphatase [Bryobacteraceae bacterium]|jgi:histidinol phosphatase-like enzyme (inositol monophosphatase family)